MNPTRFARRGLHGASVAITALLAACGTQNEPSQPSLPAAAVFQSTTGSAVIAAGGAGTVAPARLAPRVSNASTPRGYRQDAATHLYGLNRERIYSGRMPPMLYAIGVVEVDVDSRGDVRRVHWLRAPRHAPEVIQEIERTVRAAAPFPSPPGFGRVQYVDTWLWDRSGRFQLDTLTEGQD